MVKMLFIRLVQCQFLALLLDTYYWPLQSCVCQIRVLKCLFLSCLQTDGMQCVYYAAPDNGSMHSAYSSYPIDPSFVPDGSFMPQEYVADPANSTCQIASTPYYVPAVLPYGQESLPGSATAPLISNVAFLPGMPSYAATSAHAAFPLVAPVTTKSDIAVNQPVQSTIVSSKQFQNHAKSQKIQLHNPVAQKQELSDRSMVPIKLPHASQVGKASHCQVTFFGVSSCVYNRSCYFFCISGRLALANTTHGHFHATRMKYKFLIQCLLCRIIQCITSLGRSSC